LVGLQLDIYPEAGAVTDAVNMVLNPEFTLWFIPASIIGEALTNNESVIDAEHRFVSTKL
jgi:hypothetical protein